LSLHALAPTLAQRAQLFNGQGDGLQKNGALLSDLKDLASQGLFSPGTRLPRDFQPELSATRQYSQSRLSLSYLPMAYMSHTRGRRGYCMVKLLKHWVVEDCGRVITPMLVDEMIRGAVCAGAIGGSCRKNVFTTKQVF